MTRISILFFSFFVAFSNLLIGNTPGQQLANYLGTGSNPRLQLQLSANGPNWGAFTIDYQQIGNVPWSSDSSSNWSSWNVYDTASPANYYGTITLSSDGSSVQWNNYTAGTNGYYLDGVNLSYNNGISAYQLTVNTIYTPGGGGGGAGPFPNAPLATPAVYPGTSQPIILQVVGDQIVDNNGTPILLKGIVRPSLEWSATGQYLSTQDLSNIANWSSGGTTAHSNVIRLDLYQGYWLSSGPVTQSGSYKQIINAIVYYSTQLGMTVILDLHWVQSGQQSPMANQDSLTFWQQVATDYASFGTVLFELFNEPYGITTDVWLNGDSTYVGYQQLYDAVRGTGAQNICIVGGLDYAYDLSFVNPNFCVNGTNIVYCSHPYNSKGQPGYTGEGGTFQQNYQGVLGNYPLIFTEFGCNSGSYYPNGYNQIYSNILAFANANNVHYSAFAWWVQSGDPQFPCLIQDWTGTALYGGVNIQSDLVQNPGTLIGTPNALQSFKALPEIAGVVNFSSLRQGPGTYIWNFGDASSQTSQNPFTAHKYSRNGTYVATLTVLEDGQPPFTTSRTIQVTSVSNQNARMLGISPPNNVKGKQVIDSHHKTINVITWEATKSQDFFQEPVYYLVFRNDDLTQLVGKVNSLNKYGVYQVKDRAKNESITVYTVVGVDPNGNWSIPVSVHVHKI
ncbi:MAG: cellulase family glycosylhydrolase [Parachlamydiales bacterium]|jgi:hypothetical protein